MKMKLSKLFSCCLPIQKQKHRNERVDTNKKKKRKEAKRLKKEMADKRRKEDLEMDISMVQSVETVVMSAEFSKEDCNLEESSVDHGRPQLDEEEGRSPSPLHIDGDGDQEFNKEDCIPNKSSVDHGRPQLDEEEGRSPSPLNVDGDSDQEFSKKDCNPKESPEFSKEDSNPNESFIDRRGQFDRGDGRSPSPLKVDGDGDGEFGKEDCTLNESSIDHGTPQLDEEASKSSFLLHGGGDRARPLSQLKLDWHRHQPGVGKPTAHAGEWRTPDPPEKRDVMEEERRKILRGFFERRGNTTQNATTQATLTTEEEKLTPQPAVWHTAVPGERDEERRKILHGFVKRRGLTTCRPKKEFNK
ncbi:hypothetical protein AALO_G00062830 [Alosa alosa]|uniref:Uncharacterized protein n=1 Tax=Alosa alosa TaxID=278164 RepID=A0AAV6H3K8_9TELE|nr:hypothetical protein AALO_G00062830 [Alosa alosa]